MSNMCAVRPQDGALLITLAKPIPSEGFFAVFEERVRCSWGETTAFVCERKPALRPSTAEEGRRPPDDGGGDDDDEDMFEGGGGASVATLNEGRNVLLQAPGGPGRPNTTGGIQRR